MEKVFKSVRITNDERKAIKKKIEEFPNLIEAGKHFGVSRQVLANIVARGSGKSISVDTIRNVLYAE